MYPLDYKLKDTSVSNMFLIPCCAYTTVYIRHWDITLKFVNLNIEYKQTSNVYYM